MNAPERVPSPVRRSKAPDLAHAARGDSPAEVEKGPGRRPRTRGRTDAARRLFGESPAARPRSLFPLALPSPHTPALCVLLLLPVCLVLWSVEAVEDELEANTDTDAGEDGRGTGGGGGGQGKMNECFVRRRRSLLFSLLRRNRAERKTGERVSERGEQNGGGAQKTPKKQRGMGTTRMERKCLEKSHKMYVSEQHLRKCTRPWSSCILASSRSIIVPDMYTTVHLTQHT